MAHQTSGDNNLILLATFFSPHEAHIAKAVLEAHNIIAFVFDDEMTYTYALYALALGGIRLMVRKEDFSKAQQILATQKPLEEDEDVEEDDDIK